MNYLLSYGAAGIGDFVSTIMFLRDFEEQMPNDKLFLRFEIPYMDQKYGELLANNPYWHKYDGTQQIEKAVHFGWGESSNAIEHTKLDIGCKCVYTDVIYEAFNSRAGTHILKSRPRADIFLSTNELNDVVKSDKPICTLNIGYNIMHGNSRNWGWSKFQYVVNSLKDKVTFVQVGSTVGGYFHFPLANAINLVDKSPLRLTLSLINQSRFVLTHNSGLLHMSAFDSLKKRTTICISGGRDYYNFMDAYDAQNVEIVYVKNNEKFSKCYDPGKYCCDCGKVFSVGLRNAGNQIMCKMPSYDYYGNVICSCFNAIHPDEVVKLISSKL